MRGRIVLVTFPFDDFSASKVRPAVCLTDAIGPHGHVVVAFITSRVQQGGLALPSDLVLAPDEPEFAGTGLRLASTIRLHRLLTVPVTLMPRQLGMVSARTHAEVIERLRGLFG